MSHEAAASVVSSSSTTEVAINNDDNDGQSSSTIIHPIGRRESSLDFDSIMMQFHMDLAEGDWNAALVSLSDLQYYTVASENPDATARSLRQEMLDACIAKVPQDIHTRVQEQLKSACQEGQDDLVMKSFSFAQVLGFGRKAALTLVGHLRQKYKLRARGLEKSVRNKDNVSTVGGYASRQGHVEALNELMSDASRVMSAINDISSDEETKRTIWKPLHEDCVTYSLSVLDIYSKDARLSSWESRAIQMAKKDSTSSSSSSSTESDDGIQMIDLILDEMAVMNQICASYVSFVTNSLQLDFEKDALSSKILELNGVYVLLERFYIFQTMQKAIEIAECYEIEESVSSSSVALVASFVEDICFVLDKAFNRASQSLTYSTVLSITMAILDQLECAYLPALLNIPNRTDFDVQMLKIEAHDSSTKEDGGDNDDDDLTTSFHDALLMAVDDDLTAALQQEAKLIVAINSAHVSKCHVVRLQSVIQDASCRLFPSEASVTDCLPKSLGEIMTDFSGVVDNGVSSLLSTGALMTELSELMADTLECASYSLTEAQYDHCEVHGSAVSTLMEELLASKTLKRYQRRQSPETFSVCVSQLCKKIVTDVEACLMKMTFNEWGSMQLERDVSKMLSALSSLLVVQESSLRSLFKPLDEVVLILNVIKPSDVLEYQESLVSSESRSIESIEAILKLRSNFDRDSIQRTVDNLRKNKS